MIIGAGGHSFPAQATRVRPTQPSEPYRPRVSYAERPDQTRTSCSRTCRRDVRLDSPATEVLQDIRKHSALLYAVGITWLVLLGLGVLVWVCVLVIASSI